MSLAINPDRYIARRPDGGFYSEADQLEYQAHQNARPQVSLHATLEEGDDPVAKLKELHQLAENLLEDQCDELLTFVAFRQAMRMNKHKAKEAKAQSAQAST